MKKVRKKKSLLKLPDPNKTKRRKRRAVKCPECKQILRETFGWGFCDSCFRGVPLPVGRVVNNRQRGKYVYLLRSLLKEVQQDVEDVEESRRIVRRELKNNEFIIVELYEED